ncbi:MAG: mreC [Mucilaginibacter sp.]|uniref:rod shape-determining protein MreC n=1 Tax=Mucilaginibacter sp. TaxID=1882438 RepID=UPI00262C1CDD|nr:rod shape-determining protein MreC [Mucilaginibacter sp.]MDB5005098.1 mreC [Mucilaginibacter sp.]
MRNLLIFISKYNAFFLFIIFEVSALVIYVKYNSFQKATFINSTNKITSNLYAQADQLKSYISLREVNDSLARENAMLRNQLKSSFYIDSVSKHKITDTVYKQQYQFIEAAVINNSINHRNNYLTINKGSHAGIEKGMGVICGQGVVGKVVLVSEYMSVVQSVLHKETRISAMLADHKDIGSFIWGGDLDARKGLLVDVANNAQPRLGEKVVTTEYSLFPSGIPIGKVSNLHTKEGGSSLNMEVELAVDFGKLQYVNVVINKLAKEQLALEGQEKKDE